MTTLQKLAERSIEQGDCWVWTGAKTNGYGRIWDGQHSQLAHRLAYRELVGEVPDGLVLDHLCRTRACWNPWHLDPVPNRVNVIRGDRKTGITHCPAGHPYDEANTYVDPTGRRFCRECRRQHRRNYRLARRAVTR